MFKTTINVKKTSENKELDLDVTQEVELMDEFDQTKVEPSNFTRKTLLECDDILSYL